MVSLIVTKTSLKHNLHQINNGIGEGRADPNAEDQDGDHHTGDPLLLLVGVAGLGPQHHAEIAEVAVGDGEHGHQGVVVRVVREQHRQVSDVGSCIAQHEQGNEHWKYLAILEQQKYLKVAK